MKLFMMELFAKIIGGAIFGIFAGITFVYLNIFLIQTDVYNDIKSTQSKILFEEEIALENKKMARLTMEAETELGDALRALDFVLGLTVNIFEKENVRHVDIKVLIKNNLLNAIERAKIFEKTLRTVNNVLPENIELSSMMYEINPK